MTSGSTLLSCFKRLIWTNLWTLSVCCSLRPANIFYTVRRVKSFCPFDIVSVFASLKSIEPVKSFYFYSSYWYILRGTLETKLAEGLLLETGRVTSLPCMVGVELSNSACNFRIISNSFLSWCCFYCS